MPKLPFLSPSRGLALLLLLGAAAIAQVPAPITALSAGQPTPFPNATDNSFESTVPINQTQIGNWASWVMTGNSGIAGQGHFWVAPLTAPGGRRVAFLQGASAISTSFQPTTGNWRLRFRGAQRMDAASHQVVQVWMGPTLVYEGELQAGAFQEYRTRTVRFTPPLPVTMTVAIQGTNTSNSDIGLVDLIELEPVADWQAASSWSPPQVPTAGDPAVIPSGVEVAIRGAATADSVQVNGELVTAFENATLDTKWVSVSGATARFEVGQERTPFAQDFTLTLLGSSLVMHSPHAGTKFLMAMDGGTIDMHGSHKTSWTKLTSLVPGGIPSTMDIHVLEKDGWTAGDEIVVAPTVHVSHDQGSPACLSAAFDVPYSQRRTISNIDPATGTITLAGTLDPARHGTWTPVQYPKPGGGVWLLDQRAEVGMLTRNVHIRGSAALNGFGGHVMIMDCCTMMTPGLGRFSDIELSNMGQKQILGRYPLHWHMVRNARPGQYVRNSSIHDNNNRAITVHGSHRVVVENNVCFDTVGHAVFLEDGVEHDNQFLHNLVLATRKPAACEQMLPHDNSRDQVQNRSPSAFWISNPNNHFVDNVAADSLGTGYWFAVHVYPTGLSTTTTWSGEFTDFVGQAADLGTFSGNVAHSLKMGVDVHDTVIDGLGAVIPVPPCSSSPPSFCPPVVTSPLLSDPRDDDIQPNGQWRPVHEAVLTGFTAYGCTSGIYTGAGINVPTQVRFHDCVLADNGAQVQVASPDTISKSLFVYDSGHVIFPTGTNGLPHAHLQGFESGCAYVVYDGPGRVFDSHFIGYDGSTNATFVFSAFGAAGRHTNHLFHGLTFAGGFPAIEFVDFASLLHNGALAQPWVWGIAIVDQDGSLSGGIPANPYSPYPAGQTVHTLISNHPMMHLVAAVASPDIAIGTNAYLSPFRWAHLQVRCYEGSGTYDPQTNLYANYDRMAGDQLPPAIFTRRSYYSFPASSFTDTYGDGTQMRQMPIIVKPGTSTAPECTYEVQVTDLPIPIYQGLPERIDISVDDAAIGDVTRLIITNGAQPNWNPTLRFNDASPQIHADGQHPNGLPLVPNGPPGASTSYLLTMLGGATAIDLHLVNPKPTHRITITW